MILLRPSDAFDHLISAAPRTTDEPVFLAVDRVPALCDHNDLRSVC
jgi:hypothetical protein